ncbi:hypothetical protein QCM77_18930 [Bradyrhizobium sp. SSUT18]|uniref:hypothetical protein n=1 Tax=Bradyrhizobium sp. SSUT18 TaxID=3040602 RepID=UPI00244CA53F|nr:hypothetical protein [Bradyrhizobium sp. SSUT18]MDH2402017.1 hypothetical protein [Bradyrhizobium sp. SSUT18]
MKQAQALLTAVFAAALSGAPLFAQNAPVSNHAVPVGKGPGVTGYTNVAPGTAGIPLTSTGASTDPSFSAIAAAGIQSNAVTNAKINPGSANTFKGSLNGSATSDIALTACTLSYQITKWVAGTGWQCGLNPVLPSRAIAATLDLSAFSAVTTQGYGSASDGGGATFKKITSGNFIDSFVATGSVSTAGTCSTNGTFYGVSPTGGTGGKLQGIVVIAGGAITSFTPTGSKGNAYTAGDALTIPNGSYNGSTLTCSVSPQWTVATVTTPSASFTDSVGTKFQYVVDNGNFPNVRQFGAKLDRAGKANDGLATNDQAAVQNALNFTGYGVSNVDTGGYAGGKVIVPAGTALICNGLIAPFSVKLSGVSNSGTTLKQCDADGSTQQFVTLGDPQNHQTAHFVGIEHMTLFGANAPVSGTVAMVYSNSANSDDAIVDVSIYPIYRACAYTETGYGGASIFHIRQMYCVPNSSVTPFGVSLNGAANNVIDGGTWFSAGGPVWGGQAILQNTNGPAVVNRFVDIHCENVTVCAYINTPAGGNGLMTYISGMVGNATVVDLIQRVTGSTANQLKVELIGGNGSNCTVRNAGSCVATGNIIDTTKY